MKVGQLTPDELQHYTAILKQRGANQACPRCRFSIFTILDQVTHVTAGGGFGIPGGLPCVTVVCNKCGFVSSHLMAVLDGAPPNG